MFWLAAPILALTAVLPTQEPTPLDPSLVAEWNGGNISVDRFDQFLGAALKHKQAGLEALEHLLQIRVVESEARRRRVAVDLSQVDVRAEEARTAIEAQGLDFDKILSDRGLTQRTFRDLLEASLLHELLVQLDRPGGSDAPVTPDELRNWTDTQLKRLREEAEVPPNGYVFKTEHLSIAEKDLGSALRAALPHGRLEEYARQLALQDVLNDWSKRTGTILREDALQAEIDWRRKRVSENPAFGGATYEGLLKAEHSSLEQVLQSDELRAAGYLWLLSEQKFSDEWFANLGAEEAASLERQFGEARLVSWILLRSVDKPVDPLDLSHADARAELNGYKSQVESAADFLRLAEQYSEDEPTRRRRGLLGWIHREEPGVEPMMSEAAFAAVPDKVHGPVQTLEGQSLMFVLEVRPRPDETTFRKLVRRSKHAELRATVLLENEFRSLYTPTQ